MLYILYRLAVLKIFNQAHKELKKIEKDKAKNRNWSKNNKIKGRDFT